MGPEIRPSGVQAGSSDTGADAVSLIDRSGLGEEGTAHSTNPAHMWRSAKGQLSSWVEFDLGGAQPVGTICLWNYNDVWYTGRGIGKADISVWTQEAGWQKVRENLSLEQAEGSGDYDDPMFVKLDVARARKIRLDALASCGDADHVGLSEVQFFAPRGPQATQPNPSDGAVGVRVSDLELAWAAGEGAKTHSVYLGTGPNDLKSLGQIEQIGAKLSQLDSDTKYYWRIDEGLADGSTATGRTWSFITGGLIAWWKFDETGGQYVSDASVCGNVGTLEGNPTWQPARGRMGGTLEFDGDGDFVRIFSRAPFVVTDEISVSAWINVRKFDKTSQTIVGKGNYAWQLARDGDRDSLQFAGGRPEDNRLVHGHISVNDGQWHHVVGVADTANVALYVDGVLDQTLSSPGHMWTDDAMVTIGENSDSMSRGRYWNGWIDDVSVFAYALDADDVKVLYSGKGPTAVASRKAPEMPRLLQATLAGPVDQVLAQADQEPAARSRNLIAVVLVIGAVGLIGGVSTPGRQKAR